MTNHYPILAVAVVPGIFADPTARLSACATSDPPLSVGAGASPLDRRHIEWLHKLAPWIREVKELLQASDAGQCDHMADSIQRHWRDLPENEAIAFFQKVDVPPVPLPEVYAFALRLYGKANLPEYQKYRRLQGERDATAREMARSAGELSIRFARDTAPLSPPEMSDFTNSMTRRNQSLIELDRQIADQRRAVIERWK